MIKTIIALLKRRFVRLTIADTWLVWNDTREEWEVYHCRKRRAVGDLVISTSDEAEAVAAFLKAAGIEEEI